MGPAIQVTLTTFDAYGNPETAGGQKVAFGLEFAGAGFTRRQFQFRHR